MKKTICLFLCILLFLPTISCGKTYPVAEEILSELCRLLPEGEERCLLYGKSESETFTAIDEDEFGFIYTGIYETPNCFSRIESFSIRLPIDDSGFEIHVLKGFNRSDAEELLSLLEKRLLRIQNAEIREFAPENYERYYVGAELYQYKNFIFLLATPDNLTAKKEIRKLL